MASIVVNRSDLFPATTVVKAYLRNGFHTGSVIAKPAGTVQGEAEMTGTPPEATINGLVAGTEYMLYAEVNGEVKTLLAAPEPAALTNPITGLATPAVHKLLGMSFDPVMASATKILETAGTLHYGKVFVPEPCKIKEIVMWMTSKASALTALENGLGLFAEGTRALLSAVAIAELIEKWEGATGEVALSLLTPAVVPAGFVTAGGYYKGTTAPTFAAAPATIGAVNVGVSGTSSRYGTGDTGLTTALPNPIASSAAASSQPFWIGVR